jgi:hypothetical protein
MRWYKKANYTGIEAYHGSPNKIIEFATSFAGKGHDQEGPGIYFTNSFKQAQHYTREQGGVITVELNVNYPRLKSRTCK